MRCSVAVKWLVAWIAVLISAVVGQGTAVGQDADGDGLPDDVEMKLGTDKDFAEKLVTLGRYPAGAKEHPKLDVVRVDFAGVADERWLWKIHFAEPYTFDNSSLIVYLDSDNDPATGRAGMGCELMLSHNGGRPGVTGFTSDGSGMVVSLPRVALVEGVLYLCHDCPIRQHDDHSVFRFTVLSETREPHASADGTGWTQAEAPSNSTRPKVVMLDDIVENENFETTEGLDLIWRLQADPANVALSSVGTELRGMGYYDAEYRWPAVRGNRGSMTVTVPKAGSFYPAVVVYDTAGPEAYELEVKGKRAGRFLAAEDDNRQRVHFLAHPVDFAGGEKLTFRVGTVGNHITEDILLLAAKPPVRARKFELSHEEAARVKREGKPRMRLTWITSWPSACTVEYGASKKYTEKLTEEAPVANHRMFLSDFEPGTEIHYRIVAPRPDGQEVVGNDRVFRFAPPAPVAGTARSEKTELTVANPYPFALEAFPITSGVPFGRGELGDAEHVRLVDAAGREVPLQAKVATRWSDGSVQWLRLSFLATAAAGEPATYFAEYGTEITRSEASSPLRHSEHEGVLTVNTGPLRMEFDAGRSGFPCSIRFDADADGRFAEDEELATQRPLAIELVDAEGGRYTTAYAADRIEIEESGPVRTVVKLSGGHRDGSGRRMFAYVNRFTFFAGLPSVKVQTTWGNDSAEAKFSEFGRLSLHVPFAEAEDWRWAVGLGGGNESNGRGELGLLQLRDDAYKLTPRAPEGTSTERADGWIDVSNGRWGLMTAVRDFWQLYPKGFRVTPEGLAVDLAPHFPGETYVGSSKLEEVKLYYYLMGGKYKVRRGTQKQHELMLHCHAGELEASERQRLSQAFQEPLIAACMPERYCGTQVFGEILPATAGRTPEYEKVCEQVYRNAVSHRERGHEYGMLNFGDQWGERKVNWANGEYDHHHAYLMQFIRTADPRWYFLAEKAVRHAIDVDTAHYGPRKGGEWIHSMGHVGDYFASQYEGSGISYGGMSVSHTWTEGFRDWYVLNGDPTAYENAVLVADHYDGAYLNNYDWSNCRTNGWHLLLTMAVYRMTNDPYYLNAARIIIERTLERQTPGGGWHRQMVPGHCHDMPRHRGVANFMLGVLANGLEEYYGEVPDPRVAEAIIGGAGQAIRELWVEEARGFRYTSCPNMTGYTSNNDMTSEILFFAHRLGGDEEFGRIAMEAMEAAFDGGIGSTAHLRWTPHIIYNIDLLQQKLGTGRE